MKTAKQQPGLDFLFESAAGRPAAKGNRGLNPPADPLSSPSKSEPSWRPPLDRSLRCPVGGPKGRERSAARRDEVLEISRRLDWRFLLPDPSLQRVACLGIDDRLLVAALKEFCTGLRFFAGGRRPTRADLSTFDVVVLHSPGLEAAACAAALLKEGGHLYWEVERPWSRIVWAGLRAGAGRRAARPLEITALERFGFSPVVLHWHHPGFDACHQMIPLEDPRAVEFVLQQQFSSSPSQRQKALLLRLLDRLVGLSHLVPCVSLVARRAKTP